METVTGTAAGVPFTALPPTEGTDGHAPLIVTWHMLDAPRTDAAFAAALPMAGVPRVAGTPGHAAVWGADG